MGSEIILGTFNDENGIDAIRIDAMTNFLISISNPHAHVHEASRFYVVYSVADLGAMGSPDDMITLDFTTPNTTKWGHFIFRGKGTPGSLLRLIEAPSGGAASPTGQLPIINRHRNSSNVSVFTDGSTANQVNYDATLATGGSTIWNEYLEGTGGPQSGGAVGGDRDELILKQNTKYQLSLFGSNSDPATLLIGWYEHTNIR